MMKVCLLKGNWTKSECIKKGGKCADGDDMDFVVGDDDYEAYFQDVPEGDEESNSVLAKDLQITPENSDNEKMSDIDDDDDDIPHSSAAMSLQEDIQW